MDPCWTLRSSLSAMMAALLLTAAAQWPAAAQTMQTRQVMRQKLTQAERLLAALVTSNWTVLERSSRALDALTQQRGWDVMQAPEFAAYTGAFQRAVQALVDAAGERDQRRALEAYTGLVGSCVECHRYVARARIARR